MRLNIFLSILSFAIPISLLNGSMGSAEAFCEMPLQAGLYLSESSGYKLISRAKRCNSKKVEFVQIGNCWEPGDLLSQKRYCLGEGLTVLG